MNIAPSSSKQVTIVKKEFGNKDLIEQVCKPADDEYKPNEQDLVVDAHLEGCLGVIRSLLVAHRCKNDPKIHNGRIFQTRAKCTD